MNEEMIQRVLRYWQVLRVFSKKLMPAIILFLVLGIPVIVAVVVYRTLSPDTWFERLVSIVMSFVMWLIATRIVTDAVIFVRSGR